MQYILWYGHCTVLCWDKPHHSLSDSIPGCSGGGGGAHKLFWEAALLTWQALVKTTALQMFLQVCFATLVWTALLDCTAISFRLKSFPPQSGVPHCQRRIRTYRQLAPSQRCMLTWVIGVRVKSTLCFGMNSGETFHQSPWHSDRWKDDSRRARI